MRVFLLVIVTLVSVQAFKGAIKPPNIIYILADDMGWNDVSFHGSDQIPTPNIDSIGYHGVILNRHYVQPVCTPTRASLLTGKYPLHTGLHTPLAPSHRVGLDLNEKILPQYLKDLGYSNYMVGKWHVGFYEKPLTPLERGFDSHFGYWSGAISYYDHIDQDMGMVPPYNFTFSGHDMRRGFRSAWDVQGQYATDLFTQEAIQVIQNHPQGIPMFLYIAHLAVHAGNEGKWLEAPQEEINTFSYIADPNRRSYAAMVSKLDQSVGAIIEALDDNDMLKNSIIVFVSDNGAPSVGEYNNWGSNYPWRGQKRSLWEGGVRTPAAIWSPLIKIPSRVSYSLMHVTDWLPTLLAIAGCGEPLKHIDGVNQWKMISEAQDSSRSELVVDIDQENNMTALVHNNFKYLKGPLVPNAADKQYNTFLNVHSIQSPNAPAYSSQQLLQSPGWQVLEKYSRDPGLLHRVSALRREAEVTCDHDFQKVLTCTDNPCLFDIISDPCEQTNIADMYPEVVSSFLQKIDNYETTAVPSIPLIRDPNSNPELHNGTWSIWVA